MSGLGGGWPSEIGPGEVTEALMGRAGLTWPRVGEREWAKLLRDLFRGKYCNTINVLRGSRRVSGIFDSTTIGGPCDSDSVNSRRTS